MSGWIWPLLGAAIGGLIAAFLSGPLVFGLPWRDIFK